jgi:hypothetical protein
LYLVVLKNSSKGEIWILGNNPKKQFKIDNKIKCSDYIDFTALYDYSIQYPLHLNLKMSIAKK